MIDMCSYLDRDDTDANGDADFKRKSDSNSYFLIEWWTASKENYWRVRQETYQDKRHLKLFEINTFNTLSLSDMQKNAYKKKDNKQCILWKKEEEEKRLMAVHWLTTLVFQEKQMTTCMDYFFGRSKQNVFRVFWCTIMKKLHSCLFKLYFNEIRIILY